MATLMIRKTIRHDVSIRAAIRVATVHQDVVRVSSAVATDGWILVDCVDASLGGLGFISTSFVPRMTQVYVRLLRTPDPTDVLLECPCVVRRVVMTDRRPAYHLGCSFGVLTPEVEMQLSAMLTSVGGVD